MCDKWSQVSIVVAAAAAVDDVIVFSEATASRTDGNVFAGAVLCVVLTRKLDSN